jgi:hypothetical protein
VTTARAEANATAVAKLVGARPMWSRVRPARELIPALDDGVLLHAGPPLRTAPGRVIAGALAGALLFEGRTESYEDGLRAVAAGDLKLAAGNDHSVAAPLAGVVSPGMSMIVIRDMESGLEAYSPLSEGGGCALRFGCVGDGTLEVLRRLAHELGPLLDRLLLESGPIDLYALIQTALHLGDDCHHRFRALGMVLELELVERCESLGRGADERTAIRRAVADNAFFPLNLVAAASKAAALAAEGVNGSSLVTAIARNGVEAGVRLSGLPGDWFTAPVEPVTAIETTPGASEGADPDTGDSCIIEVNGLGAFALAGAPALSKWFGGDYRAMTELVAPMAEITLARHPVFTIPALGFLGTPVGIDAELALRAGVAPLTETILVTPDATPPIGAIGYGRAPIGALESAVAAL